MLSDHLSITIEDFKAANSLSQDGADEDDKKYVFNPLVDRPFIVESGPDYLAPSVHLALMKFSPLAIYHRGIEMDGNSFSTDLGAVFQHYVGRQLGLIAGAKASPEVKYSEGRFAVDSCDWIVELPGSLLLIECKASRSNEHIRTAGARMVEFLGNSIGKGIRQLNRTRTNFAAVSPLLIGIDVTKPVRFGIVVTLEPFFFNNNPFVRDVVDSAEFPVAVASSFELEALVNLTAEELEAALDRAETAGGDFVLNLNEAIRASAGRDNPLILSAWDDFEFFARVAEAAGEDS